MTKHGIKLVSLTLVLTRVALGQVDVMGERSDVVVITNPAGDWLSPSRARHTIDTLVGGADAGTKGDALGYRLTTGSLEERQDNELIVPVQIAGGTGAFTVRVGVLAAGPDQTPLTVYLNRRKVGEVDLTGETDSHLVREVAVKIADAEMPRPFHLIRIVDENEKGSNRATFIDSVVVKDKGVGSAEPMQALAVGSSRFVVRRSWEADGSFRLFQVGRFLNACIERRSYHRELFRKERIRFPKNGYRQIGHTMDSWHTIYTVKRDAAGRQLENWAEMPRDFLGDHEASSQERGFRIVFDSPCAGKATLKMHCSGGGVDTSMVVVVNGDVGRARVGETLPVEMGPGSHTVKEGAAASMNFDVKNKQITEITNVPVRRGRNMIDFDYAGFGFLWPAKSYPSLAESFDYITCDVVPAEPLAAGEDTRFTEFPLAGKRYAQPAEAEVDFDTAWSFNGQKHIPKTLFGVTSYNKGSGMDTKVEFDVVRRVGIGMLYGGLNYGVGIPPPVDEHGKPADYEAVWSDYERRFADSPRWQPGVARKSLQMAARLGIPYIVSMTVSGWGVHGRGHNLPMDVEKHAAHLMRLAEIVKKHAPEWEYLHLGGETDFDIANSALLRPAGYEDKTAPQIRGIVARAFGEKLHKKFPEMKIIGPENWGPPFGGPDAVDFVGHRFDDWVRPYLEEAWPQLHGYGYHCYWSDYTEEQTGELQTLANFMQVRFGEQKPMYMTEGHLGGFEWMGSKTKLDERALWLYNGYHVLRALCYSVETCDKLKALLWHDLHGWTGQEWATFRSRAKGLPAPKAVPEGGLDMTEFMPLYGGLWLFRDLRGVMIKTSTGGSTEQTGLRVLAALNGNVGSCVILNGSLDPRPVKVKLHLAPGASITDVAIECMEARDNFYRIVAEPLPDDRWQRTGDTLTIQALPLAGYHVRVRFDAARQPQQSAGRTDYYGDRVMVGIHQYLPEGEIVIICPSRAGRAERASLRIAYESLLLEPEEVEWSFNGTPIEVNLRDYIEIPVPAKKLRQKNVLLFRLRNPATANNLKVRSAVVAVEYQALPNS